MVETLSEKEAHWMYFYELWRKKDYGCAGNDLIGCAENNHTKEYPRRTRQFTPGFPYAKPTVDITV